MPIPQHPGDRLRQAAAQAMGMDAFDDRAFTEQVEKIVTTEGEALEFHFFDGRVKEVPILLFRSNHNTLGANLPFPGYNWTSAGYVPKQDEVPMVRMVYELYADGMKIERFIESVKDLPELITEFDESLWAGLVDSLTVYSMDRIVWKLT